MEIVKKFNKEEVGKIRIILKEGNPWFVAKDIATCIDYDLSSINKMCNLCREQDKFVASARSFKSDELSELGNSRVTLISEQGLYRILLKSNLPKCEKFENWVFDEVLPSIRKTGSYSINEMSRKELAQMVIDSENAREEAEKLLRITANERDEAIRTKAFIGSKKVATSMNTAMQKTKEVKRLQKKIFLVRKENQKLKEECSNLKEQINEKEEWSTIQEINWLREYFVIKTGLYSALERELKGICKTIGKKALKIDNFNYGYVKAYPKESIEKLKEMVSQNSSILKEFRKQNVPKCFRRSNH